MQLEGGRQQYRPMVMALTEKDILLFESVPWSRESWSMPLFTHPLLATRYLQQTVWGCLRVGEEDSNLKMLTFLLLFFPTRERLCLGSCVGPGGGGGGRCFCLSSEASQTFFILAGRVFIHCEVVSHYSTRMRHKTVVFENVKVKVGFYCFSAFVKTGFI